MSAARDSAAYATYAMRTLFGLLVGAIAGGISWAMVALMVQEVTGKTPYFGVPNEFALALLLGGMGGAWIGIPLALAVGWPLHVILQRRRITHLLIYAAIGGALTLLAGSSFLFLMTSAIDAAVLMEFAVPGASGAILFWFIRRPDRDTTTPE